MAGICGQKTAIASISIETEERIRWEDLSCVASVPPCYRVVPYKALRMFLSVRTLDRSSRGVEPKKIVWMDGEGNAA